MFPHNSDMEGFTRYRENIYVFKIRLITKSIELF